MNVLTFHLVPINSNISTSNSTNSTWILKHDFVLMEVI